MKKLMSIGFVLLFSFFMVSCGGSSDNPQDVAKEFMQALGDQDYDKAKDLGTENTVIRITSYNVCYTKLLRGGGALKDKQNTAETKDIYRYTTMADIIEHLET